VWGGASIGRKRRRDGYCGRREQWERSLAAECRFLDVLFFGGGRGLGSMAGPAIAGSDEVPVRITTSGTDIVVRQARYG